MPTWSIQLPSSAQYENISDSVDWVLRDHMCKFCTCGGVMVINNTSQLFIILM